MSRDVPKIEVSVNGRPVHAAFYERLKSARMRDAKGTESDEVELVFDDAGNEIEEPEEGAVIEVAVGYEDEGLPKRGTYLVDKPARPSGGPGGEFLAVHGRAADMSGDLKEMASEHFEDTSLGDVLQKVGTRHGLAVKVSPSLASIPVPYLARFNQSTLGFGSDLARRYGGVFTIKNRTLLFVEEGTGSAGGLALPRLEIDKSDCESWEFTPESRPRHETVKAPWFDRAAGRMRYEEEPTGMGKGPAKVLRHPCPDQAMAKRMAKSEGDRLSKATATGRITLAGMPEAAAECEVMLSGFRPSINGRWIAAAVEDIFEGKYMTSIELEAPKGGRK